MRVGNNPNKDLKELSNKLSYKHRIIIPVYIPSEGGYFKEALKIFKTCIISILKTKSSHTAISVVNNGSCVEVENYLNTLFRSNKIQELIHTENIGKINALLKVLRTVNEDLITITDADVLFLNGWQDNTVKVFNAFPKASVVGIVPQFQL